MNDFEDILKISGQILIILFLLVVMGLIGNAFYMGFGFNPFESLLSILLMFLHQRTP